MIRYIAFKHNKSYLQHATFQFFELNYEVCKYITFKLRIIHATHIHKEHECIRYLW